MNHNPQILNADFSFILNSKQVSRFCPLQPVKGTRVLRKQIHMEDNKDGKKLCVSIITFEEYTMNNSWSFTCE